MNQKNSHSSSEIEKQKIQLRKKCEKIIAMRNSSSLKKPIIIELCGSPKSGKTSFLTSFNIFLKRNGFRTHVIDEWASKCPVSNKRNFSFNIWTTNNALNTLIGLLHNNIQREAYDVIIFDRAIFDGFCWFEWLKQTNSISESGYKLYTDFFKSRDWVNLIDIVCVFTSNSSVSIEREFTSNLTDIEGSIMNKEILESYVQAIKRTIEMHKNTFDYVREFDTSYKNQIEVGNMVSRELLSLMEKVSQEHIWYFDSSITRYLNMGYSNKDIIEFLSHEEINYGPRDKVESDDKKIQIIAIACITDSERKKVFVVKKNNGSLGKEASPEKDQLLAYVGGHVRKDDVRNTNGNLIELVHNGLQRELLEEIAQPLAFDRIEPFFIYTPEYSQKSKKHLAICFHIIYDQIKINNFRLDTYEFVQKKGSSLSGRVIDIDDLIKEANIESWTKEIIQVIFGKNVDEERKQRETLFDVKY
jgi:hypothetical protein